MNWDGKERRNTMFDQKFYDNMMGMCGDMKHLRKWSEDHDKDDKIRFAEINKNLIYGAIAIILVAFTSGVLGQLLEHIKIGV